jgi:hypothetical protein
MLDSTKQLKIKIGFILSTLFLISCSQTYNISYPSKSIHFYDVIMTDSLGNVKSTELKMTVGEPNFYSFISGNTGLKYEFIDLIDSLQYEEKTSAYLNPENLSLHPPRAGFFAFTEICPFPNSNILSSKIPYSNMKACSYNFKLNILANKIKVLNGKTITQKLDFSDTLSYSYKKEKVFAILWKGENLSHQDLVGQYKVEYVFSPKYAFLEWRYFLPDSSKVVLKLRDIESVK